MLQLHVQMSDIRCQISDVRYQMSDDKIQDLHKNCKNVQRLNAPGFWKMSCKQMHICIKCQCICNAKLKHHDFLYICIILQHSHQCIRLHNISTWSSWFVISCASPLRDSRPVKKHKCKQHWANSLVLLLRAIGIGLNGNLLNNDSAVYLPMWKRRRILGRLLGEIRSSCHLQSRLPACMHHACMHHAGHSPI